MGILFFISMVTAMFTLLWFGITHGVIASVLVWFIVACSINWVIDKQCELVYKGAGIKTTVKTNVKRKKRSHRVDGVVGLFTERKQW